VLNPRIRGNAPRFTIISSLSAPALELVQLLSLQLLLELLPSELLLHLQLLLFHPHAVLECAVVSSRPQSAGGARLRAHSAREQNAC
jgi:hypothetical protein